MSSNTDAPTLLVHAESADIAARMPRPLPPIRGADRRDVGLSIPAFAPDPVLDAPVPRTRTPIVFGLLVFLIFIGGSSAWSVLAPLSEAAIASGVIKVEGTRRTVQHLEGGIVREILVRDGSQAKAGQLLMRLDDIQSSSAFEALQAQRWALLAQDARLTAEQNLEKAIAFPSDLLASADLRALEAATGQRTLFETRQTSLNSQLDVLRARMDQQRAVIASNEGQLAAARQQLMLVMKEEEVTRDLLNQGLARLPQVLALQRTIAQVEGIIQSETGEIARARATIAEAEQQMHQVRDQRQQDVSTELRDVRSKLADVGEKLRAASDVATRREIVAPESGTVVNLRVFTIGGVLRPGDPILDIVPDHDQLVAEVNIQPSDIDVVYPGLQSEVRLPAFKQRLVSYLHGHVTWIAADVTANEQTHQQYYRAHVLIDRDQLERVPDVFLTPGMPVEAHIQIGQRSFFRYITQPIRDSFHRAFKEQ